MGLRRRAFASMMLGLIVLCDATHAEADWPPDGVPLCTTCNAPSTPRVISDGAGGAFVVWGDTWTGYYDVLAQRITASGEIAPGWPSPSGRGLAVSAEDLYQIVNDIAPDGYGGVLVAWYDYRHIPTEGTGIEIYAQRIMADGTVAPGWTPGGVRVTQTPGDQAWPVILDDGAGGAFVAWEDQTSFDVYLQRLTATGTPAPGWPVNGLGVCTDPSRQGGVWNLVPDGSGGVILAWGDLRDGPATTYAQRVLPDGSVAPGWPVNGVRIASRPAIGMISDESGGVFLASAVPTFLFHDDYYLHRMTGYGAFAPGWPEAGIPVCLAPNERAGLAMVGDGVGGALLVWSDFRDGVPDQIFASRFAPDGTLRPGWPVDGQRVTSDIALNDFPDLASDGMGGAFLCWTKYTTAFRDQVYLQHLTGAGEVAPGWPIGGRLVPTAGQARRARIAADGAGGAIVAWQHGDYTVRALRIGGDGPTPVQMSLVRAEAESDRVRLEWATAGEPSRAALERRAGVDGWQRLAELLADGTGRLAYEDRDVAPGKSYTYRLAYRIGVETAYSDEVRVEVPAPTFALRGIVPNPSHGEPVITFSLARAGPVTVEVYDLRGRRVLARDLGTLAARSHEFRLRTGPPLPAGVYTLRLTQGSEVATARAVVIR